MNKTFLIGSNQNVDLGEGYIIGVKNLQNSLCPSHYDRNSVCFWEGEILGDLYLLFPNGEYDQFRISSYKSSKNNKFITNYYDHEIEIIGEGYDAGRSQDEAKLKISVNIYSGHDIPHKK